MARVTRMQEWAYITQRWAIIGISGVCAVAFTAGVVDMMVSVANDNNAEAQFQNQSSVNSYENDLYTPSNITTPNVVYGCFPVKGKYAEKIITPTSDAKWFTLHTYSTLKACNAMIPVDLPPYT
jgi:hypothetical protein